MDSDLQDITIRLERAVRGLEQTIEKRDNGILISCIEAARLLGHAPNTITRMINEGRLHKVTLGKSTGIRLSELMRKMNTP